MADNKNRADVAERILTILDADRAHVEALPISDLKDRLADLDIPALVPADLRKAIVELSTPAAGMLDVLSSDSEQLDADIKSKPLADVTTELRRLGINYRAGLTEVIELAQRHSSTEQTEQCVTAYDGWKHRAARYGLAGAAAAAIVLLALNHAFQPDAVTVQVRGLAELAERNDVQAQFALGLLYATGQGGVEKNYDRSVNWWTRAAERRSSEAQEALIFARLFKDEKSLPQKWKNLVASIAKDKTDLDSLSPKEVAAKIVALANAAPGVPLNVGTSGATPVREVLQSCATQLRASPQQRTAVVTRFLSEQEVLSITRSVERREQARISPAYLPLRHVYTQFFQPDGSQGETMAAIPEYMTVNAGDVVELNMRYRDPALPCSFIPVMINRILSGPVAEH